MISSDTRLGTVAPVLQANVTPDLTQHYTVDGMTCMACFRRVQRAIAAMPEVRQVDVNVVTQRTTVGFVVTPDKAVLNALTVSFFFAPVLE